MAHSSLMGGDPTPRQPSGTDVASLGPSDLSDSGSDVGMGGLDPETLDSDSDSLGTGERASAGRRSPTAGADILPDHLEDAPAAPAADEPVDEDLQAELDFDADEVAEQAEDRASRELEPPAPPDHPDLTDTPADVGALAQDDDAFAPGDGQDTGDGSDTPPPHPQDAARGGGPGHDIGRG